MTTKDLERAYKVLRAKQAPYTARFDYYDGNQPLKYNSSRFKDIFQDLDANFSENWCAVVIDSCYNRVNLTGVNILTENVEESESTIAAALNRLLRRKEAETINVQTRLEEIASRNEILLESDTVSKVAGIIGESFYICGKDDDGKAQGFYNDPRMVHAFYNELNPRKMDYAAKWWLSEEQKVIKMILFYEDRFEFYMTEETEKPAELGDEGWQKFQPATSDWEYTEEGGNVEPNEEGIIPVFHFRPDRRKVKSDLKNVFTLQDAINKLASDMMITSEFSAFRQRFVISNAEVEGVLRNAPNEIWDIPAGDGEGQSTQVGDLAASDPMTYIEPINREVNVISSITQTPKHFFLSTNTSNISGEALIALEAPLNDKAQARIDIFIPTWRQVFSYMLMVEGENVPTTEIDVVFEAPETVQPRTRSEIREIDTRTGIPLVTVLRREGWSQEEIDQLLIDQKHETEQNQADMASMMLGAERQFDTGFEVSE